MRNLILIVLCLCLVSNCFAGRFEQKAEQSAKETDKQFQKEIKELTGFANELKELEKQNQEYDKSLCQSVNLIVGSTFLTAGIWGLTISQPYGTITGFFLTFNGIVKIINGIKKDTIICPSCNGKREVKIKGYR